MSNCPFCGTKKVSKTFNFNEYTCNLCECDYKHTSTGIKIFQEGSWASFCNSIVESVSSNASANVIDLVSKTMRGYAKKGPDEIDLVIESLSSIASTLNSEMKVGLRGKNDFLVVAEQIDTTIRAAHALHKRQDDIGVRIKLSEGILDWFKGDEEADEYTSMGQGIDSLTSTAVPSTDEKPLPVEEGAMSDLDIVAQEAVDALGEAAAEDEAVIAYVQENHPDEVEHINLILQAVHDKVQGGDMGDESGMTDVEADADTLASAGMGTDEDYGSFGGGEYDESANQEVIDELVPIYKLEKLDDPNARPDLGIEPEDEIDPELEDGKQMEVKVEDEDPFAADAGGDAGGDAAPAEGGDAGGEDPFAAGGDEGGDDTFADGEGDSDAIADVQDAAETVQDKFKRLETKIDDLLTKVGSLSGDASADTGEEAPAEGGDEAAGEEGGDDPFASGGDEGGDAEQPVEGGEADAAAPAEGGDEGGDAGGNDDPFAESYLRESKRKDKKIGVITTRGKETKASYQRKQSAAQAQKQMEEGGEDKTDMNAEVEEENIPFTEGPKEQMAKNTDSDAPGATKKPTGEVAYREGFNGFRVGDEVLVEGSTDVWNILGIRKNVFTLGRGKTTTKIDIFKENVRHSDSRLEWQSTEELMRESKNAWARVSANYVTENETKVTGVVGLGGGNRLGGRKFGASELSESTKIGVVETTASDRKDIYKYIKDNALHRCAREVAVQRVCERFTNPVEEINNIVDDAVLSDDSTQVESIDSQYGYKCAPIGENALRQAFQRGWMSVVESESKEQKPAPKKVVKESRGVGYYRTNDDKLIDGLGRTAADRLMGK